MGNASRLMRRLTGNETILSISALSLTSWPRFGRAEACVAIVIKPLQQALQDADQIYATVCIQYRLPQCGMYSDDDM